MAADMGSASSLHLLLVAALLLGVAVQGGQLASADMRTAGHIAGERQPWLP